jgi:hypothetical protein
VKAGVPPGIVGDTDDRGKHDEAEDHGKAAALLPALDLGRGYRTPPNACASSAGRGSS